MEMNQNIGLRKRAKIKETTINDFELRYQRSIVGYSPENNESVKQCSRIVWASLISSLGVAWYDLVSLLWSGWNTRHHFQIFLLLHWVTSAVTATLYDSGNSSY